MLSCVALVLQTEGFLKEVVPEVAVKNQEVLAVKLTRK